MTAFVFFFLPVTIALGVWQIQRGDEKTRLEAQFLASQGQLPTTHADIASLPAFTRVRLEGRYDPDRYLLLDNQTRDGRVGYAVLSLFNTDDGRAYLINRGWVPSGSDRSAWPRVATPDGRVSVTGSIWRDAGLSWAGRDENWNGSWPARIQRIDVEQFGERIAALVPVEIRLEPGTTGALETRYVAPVFGPEKHYGYAVQWFLLAAVLAALYAHFGLRRARSR